jgi:BirA family biotin operon repressor/biotin-[acetyl-CoA-carboxylase] ligase
MSLVLRWSDPAQTPALLPLLAGVAVCDVAGPEALVKWPNDIVLERTDGGLAKLAGILVEGRPQQQWAVLGIGLNVALELEDLPAELRSAAASLGLPAAMVEPTLQRLLEALAIRLAEAPAEVLKQLRARDALRGREVTWAGGHGHAEGIKDDGQLIVATAAGERVLLGAGEVHLHKPGEMPA